MNAIIEGAKVMAKGQITLPKDIREKLGVGTGDRLVLMWDGERVVMMNAALFTMRALQGSLEGAAAQAGIASEDDVAELVSGLRTQPGGA